jgi:hypothetical protein
MKFLWGYPHLRFDELKEVEIFIIKFIFKERKSRFLFSKKEATILDQSGLYPVVKVSINRVQSKASYWFIISQFVLKPTISYSYNNLTNRPLSLRILTGSTGSYINPFYQYLNSRGTKS